MANAFPSPSDRPAPLGNGLSVRAVGITLLFGLLLSAAAPSVASAFGESSLFEIRSITYRGDTRGRPTAPRRLGWEVRKRTSIAVELSPRSSRLDDPTLFEQPFVYWSGEGAFPPLSEAEILGLRRFVRFGGFVLIDDSDPSQDAFDTSIRRALARAFPGRSLTPLAAGHTLYRSFYLLNRPVGRVEGPESLEALSVEDRVAILYSRHDLGGAWARDNLGSWVHNVVPGGDEQRELALRLGVNIVMYALCLDYKDDQVHAPFIMRRRGGN